ncbi:MAG TPA: HD domain-containing protein [Vicinamibacterales bacterium]|nr:HD domain-containing protein [Vicinamibacterales bacterium]
MSVWVAMGPAKGRDVDQAELRLRLSASLEQARRELIDATERGEGGRAALARHAESIDRIIRELVEAAHVHTQTPLAVCAVGGYGRKSQFLHSDIDLLMVFGAPIGRPEERFVKALLHPLWDLRFEVGHHVREIADFDRLDTTNPEYLLALMDLRPLAGDRELTDKLQGLMRSSAAGWRPQILDALVSLTDQRHSEFHDTLYQLEPDVKDGPGALRDVWAARMMLRLGGDRRRVARGVSPDRLSDAEEFLMRIRSGLHADTGRNVNVLSYELQEKAVDRLRYAGADMRRRVEALMTDYFKDARSVTRALGRVRRAALPPEPTPIQLIGENLMWVVEGITFADTHAALAAPADWLLVFDAAVSRNVPVADDALALMEREQQKRNYAPEVFHSTPQHQRRLLQFMRPRPGLSARLSEMRDCGLLGAIFPELNEIACRVTRDFYHKYTVDEHTLLTVRNAERLLNNPRFAPILREVHAPELLVLALLYHDVGKAREGDHSIVGADMALAMSRRLGLDDEASQTIDFLIRNHLKMSKIAFRRDTEEPAVVRQFASMFSTEEQLKMLVLLTLCDVGAVSPETLTPWKEELLWRLYVDAYNHMTLGYADDIIDRDQALVATLQANRPTDIPEADMARVLEGLPRRYLILFSQDAIYRHVRLARDIKPNEAHFFLAKKAEAWELTVVSLDKPFLFSNICGVLAYYGMDILRGHALTSPAGLALDVFQFADSDGFFERNSEGPNEFDRRLREVISGVTDVTALLRSKEGSVLTRRALVRRTPVVHFDTGHSQRYTVLELVADDAPGLLHRVSRVISDRGIDVDLVLISTEGQKAIDVFHITRGGSKLSEDDEALLKADLERMLKETV